MTNFYLAGPFFNSEQLDVVQQIEECADTYGLDCFSPRIKCLCPPDAPPEQRKKSFEGNCKGIIKADFVLARIDDFDPGTIWELGFAYGYKMFIESAVKTEYSPLKVYAFTNVPTRGLNLMLAQSVDGFLQGMPSVLKFLEEMSIDDNDSEAQKWRGNII